MELRTIRAVSSAAMADVQSAHRITLHMKDDFTANITIPNSSKRKET